MITEDISHSACSGRGDSKTPSTTATTSVTTCAMTCVMTCVMNYAMIYAMNSVTTCVAVWRRRRYHPQPSGPPSKTTPTTPASRRPPRPRRPLLPAILAPTSRLRLEVSFFVCVWGGGVGEGEVLNLYINKRNRPQSHHFSHFHVS